jgi:hypothetical protein
MDLSVVEPCMHGLLVRLPESFEKYFYYQGMMLLCECQHLIYLENCVGWLVLCQED